MNKLEATRNACSITYCDRSIGPAHDPYGQEEITITFGERRAAYVSNGLGMTRYALLDGAVVVRQEEWFGRNPQAKLKAQILARRHLGLSFDDARDAVFERHERCSGPGMDRGAQDRGAQDRAQESLGKVLAFRGKPNENSFTTQPRKESEMDEPWRLAAFTPSGTQVGWYAVTGRIEWPPHRAARFRSEALAELVRDALARVPEHRQVTFKPIKEN